MERIRFSILSSPFSINSSKMSLRSSLNSSPLSICSTLSSMHVIYSSELKICSYTESINCFYCLSRTVFANNSVILPILFSVAGDFSFWKELSDILRPSFIAAFCLSWAAYRAANSANPTFWLSSAETSVDALIYSSFTALLSSLLSLICDSTSFSHL